MDGIVANIEELNDLWLGEVFDYAFARAKVLHELAGVLNKQNNVRMLNKSKSSTNEKVHGGDLPFSLT